MKPRTLVITIVVLLIFLGIYWLTTKRGFKEGLETNIQTLGPSLSNIFNDKLLSSGIDATDYTRALPGALDTVTSLLNAETANARIPDSTPPTDLSTVIDTTGRDYNKGSSYFAGKRFSDGFCEKNSSNAITRNQQCGVLTNENCNQTDCCVLMNGKKCVAGDANGPTFSVDDQGKDIDYKYYTYKNNCYGDCGKGLSTKANPCNSYASTDKNINEKCIEYLWTESGCPNAAYIKPSIVASLQSLIKAAIGVKFKKALTDEPNYAKCYGPDETKWPEPCDNTTSTSKKLSSRCLTKLFLEAGCTNTPVVNADYATQNNLVEKQTQMNIFNGWANAMPQDTASLTKCYGPDPLTWPDPCANTTDTSTNLTPQCMSKLAIDTACPNPTFPDTMITQDFIMNNSNMTKAGMIKYFYDNYKWNWNDDRMQTCYGDDTNKWPFFNTRHNNGWVSCKRYCQGFDSHAWNAELPSSWKGATAVAAGAGRDFATWFYGRTDWRTPGILPCTCMRNDPVGYSPYNMRWAYWWGRRTNQ
jgi:hypothetical protein